MAMRIFHRKYGGSDEVEQAVVPDSQSVEWTKQDQDHELKAMDLGASDETEPDQIWQYRRAGVKAYYFSCAYDERTCSVCGALDRQRINIDDAKPGVNYPPMHPGCRCVTVAAFSKEIEDLMAKRYVKDRTTGELHEVPQDYSYSQWYEDFGPNRKDGIPYRPKYRT